MRLSRFFPLSPPRFSIFPFSFFAFDTEKEAPDRSSPLLIDAFLLSLCLRLFRINLTLRFGCSTVNPLLTPPSTHPPSLPLPLLVTIITIVIIVNQIDSYVHHLSPKAVKKRRSNSMPSVI